MGRGHSRDTRGLVQEDGPTEALEEWLLRDSYYLDSY